MQAVVGKAAVSTLTARYATRVIGAAVSRAVRACRCRAQILAAVFRTGRLWGRAVDVLRVTLLHAASRWPRCNCV